MNVEGSDGSDDGVPRMVGRRTKHRGRVRRRLMAHGIPWSSPQSELKRWNDRLRLSLKEAREHQNDLEAVPSKVEGVIANLVHLAAAAQRQAFEELPEACRTPPEQHVGGGEEASTADSRTTYRAAYGNLLDEAEALMKELRAHHFPQATLREVFTSAAPSGEERAVSLGFEAASYLWGEDAEGTARHSGKAIEAAVKVGQYLMGPSPLTLANDITKVVGEAVRNINKKRLRDRVNRVFEAAANVKASGNLKAPPLTPETSTARSPSVPSRRRGWGSTGL